MQHTAAAAVHWRPEIEIINVKCDCRWKLMSPCIIFVFVKCERWIFIFTTPRVSEKCWIMIVKCYCRWISMSPCIIIIWTAPGCSPGWCWGPWRRCRCSSSCGISHRPPLSPSTSSSPSHQHHNYHRHHVPRQVAVHDEAPGTRRESESAVSRPGTRKTEVFSRK